MFVMFVCLLHCMVRGKCPDEADGKVQLDFGSKWLQKLYTQLTFDLENKQEDSKSHS